MRVLRGAALAVLLTFLTSCARQEADGGLLSPAQIADRARPATVAIMTHYEVTGTVPHMELDVNGLTQLVSQRHYSSEKEALEAIFSAFLNRPGDYLREGDKMEFKETVGMLGTGFIITPDGYILTNAHVVQPSEDELKKGAVESIDDGDLVNNDVERLRKVIERALPGETIDKEGLAHLQDALTKFYMDRVGDLHLTRQVSAVMPSAQGEVSDHLVGRSCEVKQVGQAAPGKDIAVLKMEGTDLPTLPLAAVGERGEARAGNDLLIFGYPGKVARETSFTLQSRMQPSLTMGRVSGIKTMEDGWEVIQTDASINPGNSGGPAMNDRGQVVGLATFGFLESQGLNFAVSIDVARQFLDNLNVKPRTSAFTQQYNQALVQYDLPGHGDALRLFTQLHNSHPEVGTVTTFIQQMSLSHQVATSKSKEAAPGPPPSGVGFKPIVFLGIGAAVLGLLFLIISSSRR